MRKRIYGSLGLLSVFLAGAATVILLATAQHQRAFASPSAVPEAVVSGAYKNPLQLALLYWYPANLTASFAVGNYPGGMAFDGANIWVSNVADSTVTKLRASDGYTVGPSFSNPDCLPPKKWPGKHSTSSLVLLRFQTLLEFPRFCLSHREFSKPR